MNDFIKNMNKEFKQDIISLDANITFAEKVVDQLLEAFELNFERNRSTQTSCQLVLFKGKYYKFIIEATEKGVSFKNDIGLDDRDLAMVLNVEQKPYGEVNLESLHEAAKKINATLTDKSKELFSYDKRGYSLTINLNKDDNEQIKTIIRLLTKQGVKVRIDSIVKGA